MILADLKTEIQRYQYFEDTDIIDVALASIIATRLKLGDPIWLILIGPSSGGKSQILRPIALTSTKFMHRIDDLTDNTFLSGANVQGGKDISLLNRIGPHGMLVISDLTVIFSKNQESRNAILSQFRMIYDGEMTKFVGNKDKPATWKGYLGILAGSTPSIYSHFEEVADMGERFIYYRMKSFSAETATRLSIRRELYGRALDNKLSGMYMDYLKEVTPEVTPLVVLPEEVEERIIQVAMLSEKIRTGTHTDWHGTMDKLPVSAMPMRVSLQLISIAKGLSIMRKAEGKDLSECDIKILEWCGYSLANEEKRACLRFLSRLTYDISATTSSIADGIGLDTNITRAILQNMAATGIVTRSGSGESLVWRITSENNLQLVRRLEGIVDNTGLVSRNVSSEEKDEMDEFLNHALDNYGK